jgi:hypothetical protein
MLRAFLAHPQEIQYCLVSHYGKRKCALGRFHTHRLYAGFESGSGRVSFHTYRLPRPLASTEHARCQSDVECHRGQTCQASKVQWKLLSRTPAEAAPLPWRPTCRVPGRHARLTERQLGGACADRLCVITPIHLHCKPDSGPSTAGAFAIALRRRFTAVRLLSWV